LIRDNVIEKIEEAMGLKFPEEQLDIIMHKGSPSNVISCAGSGKTTLMIAKICYMQMTMDIDPAKIIVISFNKSAVEEIKERYFEIADKLKLSKHITFKTFHALYYMILKYFEKKLNGVDLRVMGEGESNALFTRAFYSKSKDKTEDTKDNMVSLRSYAVNNLISSPQQLMNTPKFITSEVDEQDYLEVIKEYRDLKEMNEAIDFEDLQIKMLELLKTTPEAQERVQNAWDFWFIDEYQDISKIQMEILKLSIKDPNNLVTIGDEDQAIYEFRGSKVDYIVDFPIYFEGSKRYIMNINYRCPENILKRAEVMINKNVKRVQKNMKAFNSGGKLTYEGFSSASDAAIKIAELVYADFQSGVDLSNIAILYRNTRQQIFIVDQMIQKGIPLKVMRKTNLLHNHQFINDIKNIIELALDDENPYLFTQVFTKITKFLKKSIINEVAEKMVSRGMSWRDLLMNHDNESIQRASFKLNEIKEMVENKCLMPEIIDAVLEIYSDYLEFALKTMSATKEEIEDILDYAKYVGRDKTFKKFVYYLEKAKSTIEMYSKDRDAVTITTMHTVKGLEFDKVYILEASDEVVPSATREKNMLELFGPDEASDYVEQERRLFYVACTRAKKELYISYPTYCPSRFLYEQLEGTEDEEKLYRGELIEIE